MFRVNQQTNRTCSVKSILFSELGFTNRKRLQEWLAYQPDAVGEKLLMTFCMASYQLRSIA